MSEVSDAVEDELGATWCNDTKGGAGGAPCD